MQRVSGPRQAFERACSKVNTEAPSYGKYNTYGRDPAVVSYADKTKKARALLRENRDSSAGICHKSHARNIRTKGPHEFHNVMWDPTVYRGSSYKTYQTAELERCQRNRLDDSSLRKRKFPRHQKKMGGILIPKVHAEAEIKHGWAEMAIQTDQFLHEVTSEVHKVDMCTQSNADISHIRERKSFRVPFSLGYQADTQTEGSITCPFMENVEHVQQHLSKKVLEQALLETAEETELEVIRRETRKHVQSKADEIFKIRRLVEAQKIVAEERAAALAIHQKQAEVENDAEHRLGAILFSSSCIGTVVSETFHLIQILGYLSSAKSRDVERGIVPLINNSVVSFLEKKKYAARNLLDGLLREVVAVREAETAITMFGGNSTNDRRNSTTGRSADEYETTSFEYTTRSSREGWSSSPYRYGSPFQYEG